MSLINRLEARSLARGHVTRPRVVIFSDRRIRPLPSHLAQALKVARLESGLTQKEVAARAQLGQSTLSWIERGRRSPGRETITRLAVALNLSDKVHQALLKHASPNREGRPLKEQVAQLAALPLRQLERAMLKRRAVIERLKRARTQKGGWPKRRERRGPRLPRFDRRAS
ncbi:MAG: helix-turn-helix domain-containing protein [Candidatus Dormibacteraceae bacterium]